MLDTCDTDHTCEPHNMQLLASYIYLHCMLRAVESQRGLYYVRGGAGSFMNGMKHASAWAASVLCLWPQLYAVDKE